MSKISAFRPGLKTVLKTSTVAGLAAVMLATGIPARVTESFAEAVSVEAPQVTSFADVVQAVSPAVVSVRVQSDIKPASDESNFSFNFGGRGFDELPDLSAVIKGRQAEVIRHIEDRLRDPKLSPASVAEGLRISPRYLRTVFAGTGEKVSAYIIRRRLEECAKQIRNPAWSGHTLTEIAFAWGFNSAAHFTRTFHEHFGMAPREYRRVAQH